MCTQEKSFFTFINSLKSSLSYSPPLPQACTLTSQSLSPTQPAASAGPQLCSSSLPTHAPASSLGPCPRQQPMCDYNENTITHTHTDSPSHTLTHSHCRRTYSRAMGRTMSTSSSALGQWVRRPTLLTCPSACASLTQVCVRVCGCEFAHECLCGVGVVESLFMSTCFV